MFGTTQPIPQRLDLRAFALTTALAGVVLAATIGLAAVSGAINGSKAVITAPAAPAPIYAPAARDLGGRDLGAGSASVGTSHGAPGAYRPAIAGFLPGYLGYADNLRMQNIFSSTGAPATRHAGLRAQ